MDDFKLSGETLRSVHRLVDEDEEQILADLYRELMEADVRSTRSRGPQGVRVRRRAVTIRPNLASTMSTAGPSSLPRVFMRRERPSTSHSIVHDTPPPREPEFDDDGNLLSEVEQEHDSASSNASSSEDSLDEHSSHGSASDDDSDSPY